MTKAFTSSGEISHSTILQPPNSQFYNTILIDQNTNNNQLSLLLRKINTHFGLFKKMSIFDKCKKKNNVTLRNK